jgi:acetyl esterase/lipase
MPAVPARDDRAGWDSMFAEFEQLYRAQSDEIEEKYQPRIVRATLGAVPVLDIKPKGWRDNGKVLVYVHGGAYTFFSAASSLPSSVPMAQDTRLRVIAVDYTVAPAAMWQEVIGQVIAVIRALQGEGYSLRDISVYGDSAGGALAAGSVLAMRDQEIGMPAAVVLLSPWSDITETGDSYTTLRDADPAYFYQTHLRPAADAYADPEDQKHPYVSPVYGDYSKGFPPTLIQGGTKEIFLSNFVRHYQALDTAGQSVKLDLYEGMPHAFQAEAPELPESKLARKKIHAFLKRHLDY